MSPRTARRTSERGQGLMEYTLILLLVVLAVFGGLMLVGPAIGSIFSNVHFAL